jgi:hypothetical protein
MINVLKPIITKNKALEGTLSKELRTRVIVFGNFTRMPLWLHRMPQDEFL